jgi:hypothetical protein
MSETTTDAACQQTLEIAGAIYELADLFRQIRQVPPDKLRLRWDPVDVRFTPGGQEQSASLNRMFDAYSGAFGRLRTLLNESGENVRAVIDRMAPGSGSQTFGSVSSELVADAVLVFAKAIANDRGLAEGPPHSTTDAGRELDDRKLPDRQQTESRIRREFNAIPASQFESCRSSKSIGQQHEHTLTLSEWVTAKRTELDSTPGETPIGSSGKITLPRAGRVIDRSEPSTDTVTLHLPSPEWLIKNELLERVERECSISVRLEFTRLFSDDRLKIVRDLKLAFDWVAAEVAKLLNPTKAVEIVHETDAGGGQAAAVDDANEPSKPSASELRVLRAIDELSDLEVEEVLRLQNEQFIEQRRQSESGRYRTLAEKILGRELKGVPLPYTGTDADGLPVLVYHEEICGLLPKDDSDLWRKVKAADPDITWSCWSEWGIDRRLSLMEDVVALQSPLKSDAGCGQDDNSATKARTVRTGDSLNDADSEQGDTSAVELAMMLFEWGCERLELNVKKRGASRPVFNWLVDEGELPDGIDAPLWLTDRNYETFSSYLTKARNAVQEQIYDRRAGVETRSVKHHSKLDRQAPDQ